MKEIRAPGRDVVKVGCHNPGTASKEEPVEFSYRKSFKAGPIRVTASKSGISYSAGVKGARVTKRADGRVQTTLSAPGTGMRYTTTAGLPPPDRRPVTAARTR